MYKHKNGVTIRKLNQDDLSKLLSLRQQNWWGTHTAPILNIEDQYRWYEKLPSTSCVLIGEVNDEIASVCILSDIDWVARIANISGSVLPEFRKKDIVEACCAAQIDFAFEMFNFHRINAEVLEYNLPAQQYEIGYLGFVVEGRKRQAVYKCGSYYDSIVIGLLRSEWQAQPRVVEYKGSCNTLFDLLLVEKLKNRSAKYLQGKGGD